MTRVTYSWGSICVGESSFCHSVTQADPGYRWHVSYSTDRNDGYKKKTVSENLTVCYVAWEILTPALTLGID